MFSIDSDAEPPKPAAPAADGRDKARRRGMAGGQAARMQLRACEWNFLKREFPNGFDFDGSAHELKMSLGRCVHLVATNQSWQLAEAPGTASSARILDLIAYLARHADYQKLYEALSFIVEARKAIGSLRFRRRECAICARLKADHVIAENAPGDRAG